MRDALVLRTRPGDLNELIDQAIEIDIYQRERRRKQSFHVSPLQSPVCHRPSPPHSSLSFRSDEP